MQDARCVAWAPTRHPAALVAAGLATGRVLLSNFAAGTRDASQLLRVETSMLAEGSGGRHAAVNSLAWHPVNLGRLAAGMDRRQRGDGGVLVWDVERPDAQPSSWLPYGKPLPQSLALPAPLP